MQRLLLSARYLINLAVLSALFGAAAILIYGVIVLIHIVLKLFESREFNVEASKILSLEFIYCEFRSGDRCDFGRFRIDPLCA